MGRCSTPFKGEALLQKHPALGRAEVLPGRELAAAFCDDGLVPVTHDRVPECDEIITAHPDHVVA
jgi:hypothetical protein